MYRPLIQSLGASARQSSRLTSRVVLRKYSSRSIVQKTVSIGKWSIAIVGGFGAVGWYALRDEKFHDQFEKYAPFGRQIIEYLEERDFNARKPKENESTTPFLSAVKSPGHSFSMTSDVSSNQSEEQRKKTVQQALKSDQMSKAVSAHSSEDPLPPERFFDAQSGTVGGLDSRDYLPLVLLPDDSDTFVNAAAMALNDLISSINASAVTDSTVREVSTSLQTLAQNCSKTNPRFAKIILQTSENFNDLVQSHRLLWEEYLNIQEQLMLEKSTPIPANEKMAIKSHPNTVLADYNKKLAQEVLETERLLVSFVNSRNRQDEPSPRFRTEINVRSDSQTTALSKNKEISNPSFDSSEAASGAAEINTAGQNVPAADLTTSDVQSSITIAASPNETISFGGIDSLDSELRLEIALTLLITALNSNSKVPLGPYVQQVRDAVEPFSTESGRQAVINKALKIVVVPEDVDLSPVLNEILESYTGLPSQ